MLELLAIGGGGFLTVSMLADYLHDGGPTGLLTALGSRLGHRVEVVAPGDTPRIGAWLRENAGTTNLEPADIAFFEEQLKLAYRDTEKDV